MRFRPLALTLLLLSAALVLPASSADAQVATEGTRLGWDQVAATVAEANSLIYEATFDGQAFVALTGVTCTGAASPFQCAAALPALANGAHMVQARAVAIAGSGRAESPLSAVFNFVFLRLPDAPTNLRIVPGA